MQFKVDDLVRVLDCDGIIGTVIEINDEQITVHVEKDFDLLYCDPESLELVTEWYDRGVRLPFSMDQEEERMWERAI